jgi:hypothetical protein
MYFFTNLVNKKQQLSYQNKVGYGYTLDPIMTFPIPRGSAEMRGYWVQPATDGYTRYFLPGYMAAY